MMPLNTEGTSKPAGICEKMQDLIGSLTESSVRMRDALIHRRVSEIWEIMSDKQQQVSELEQYIVLWNRMYGETQINPESNLGRERFRIRESLSELKRIEKSNASLSQSYLSAIRKALNSAGMGGPPKKNVYTKHGQYGKRNSSLILKQYG